jgi:hypothetical protein
MIVERALLVLECLGPLPMMVGLTISLTLTKGLGVEVQPASLYFLFGKFKVFKALGLQS